MKQIYLTINSNFREQFDTVLKANGFCVIRESKGKQILEIEKISKQNISPNEIFVIGINYESLVKARLESAKYGLPHNKVPDNQQQQ